MEPAEATTGGELIIPPGSCDRIELSARKEVSKGSLPHETTGHWGVSHKEEGSKREEELFSVVTTELS